MREGKKKLIDTLSMIVTFFFMAVTAVIIVRLMKTGYSHEFKPEVLMQYETLLATASVFYGVMLTYFFMKIRKKVVKSKKLLPDMLKESDIFKSQFMAMQDFNDMITMEIDSSFKITYANKRAEQVFKNKDLLNCYLRTIIAEDELGDDDVLDILDGELDSVRFMVRVIDEDGGDDRILAGYISPIIENDESAYIAQLLLRDITVEAGKDNVIREKDDNIEKLRLECDEKVSDTLRVNDKLRNSIRILSDTFIAAPLGLVIIDSSGYITNCNRAAENLFDYHETDLIGKQVDTLYTNRDITRDILIRAEKGENVTVEVDCLKSDLSHFVGMLQIKPVFDLRHNVIRYVLSFSDITKRTRLQKYILLKNQELLSINDIFMSTNRFNSLQNKLNIFLDKLFDNLEVVRKGLIYLKSDDNILELYMYKGFHYLMLNDLKSLKLKDTLCGYSLLNDKVILSELVMPKENPDIVDMIKENGISDKHIYLPIRHNEELLGVLVIFPNKSYHYENTDIDFFNMIRKELGVCIKQALEYEGLKEKAGIADQATKKAFFDG